MCAVCLGLAGVCRGDGPFDTIYLGVGRRNGSLLGCSRKDLVLVSHCALGFGGVRIIF